MLNDDFDKSIEKTIRWAFWLSIAWGVTLIAAVIVAIIVVLSFVF